MRRWIVVFFFLLLFSMSWTASSGVVLNPEAGFQYVYSDGFRSALDRVYPRRSISGDNGWYGLMVGFKYQPSNQFEIIPRAGFLLNYIRVDGGDESFLNTIIQPALAARMHFDPGASFFIEGEVSYNAVNTGSDSFNVEGGVGYAGLVGYRWRSGMNLAIGYALTSVDVTHANRTKNHNFGGLDVRLRLEF